MKIVITASLLHKARKAEREGNKAKAEEFYKHIIAKYPDSREALFAKSDLLEINPNAIAEIEDNALDEEDLKITVKKKIRDIKKTRGKTRLVAVNSLLNTARKAEREGNKIRAEEFYKRIITEFPESREALSAKFDLVEINPNALIELEENSSNETSRPNSQEALSEKSDLLEIHPNAMDEKDADESDLILSEEEITRIRDIEKQNAMKIVAVDSLLNTARKAEREGNKIRAEEFYKRIIAMFPESQEALSAKWDLLEINPNAMDKMEIELSDEEIRSIKKRSEMELQKRQVAKTLGKVISFIVIGLFIHECSIKPKLANSRCSPYFLQYSLRSQCLSCERMPFAKWDFYREQCKYF